MTALAIAGGFEAEAFLRAISLTGEVHEAADLVQVAVPITGTIGGKVFGWVERAAIAAALDLV